MFCAYSKLGIRLDKTSVRTAAQLLTESLPLVIGGRREIIACISVTGSHCHADFPSIAN